jgi:nucleotide-binding universal stress UspA family protein
MRMVIGVDWSEETFAAVRLATTLFEPQEVALVHGVDLGWFQYPVVAEAGNVQGYDDFRQAMQEAGHQLLAQTTDMLPRNLSTVTRTSEIAKPATLVLEIAAKLSADVIVVGGGSRGRLAELFLGGVSHRIALHASCTTLVAKRSAQQIETMLIAVEEEDDAGRITAWLKRFRFRRPVAATVVRVIQPIPDIDNLQMLPTEAWRQTTERYADKLVGQVAAMLGDCCTSVTTRVLTGNPAESLAEAARNVDLLVVGSHVRNRMDRFLLGSVSHALLHRSPCSVLIVR